MWEGWFHELPIASIGTAKIIAFVGNLHYKEAMSELSEAAERLIDKHNGLVKAAKALKINPGYLSRIRHGERDNPSEALLKKFGLTRTTTFQRAK